MRLTMYQVDAFTDRIFSGNPAAVCPLERWLPEPLLQAIAEENNLAETAFVVPLAAGNFELRWFTPVAEVDLCGHATLASAYVLYTQLGYSEPSVHFHTRSGALTVSQGDAGALRMDFPALPAETCDAHSLLLTGLGITPLETLASVDYLALYASEEEVRALVPDQSALRKLPLRGVIATAPGREADFVSRFFCPKFGIDEDPVTGSAHCQLAPFWSQRLGRTRLTAHQVSPRGGHLLCELQGDRVILTGHSALYMVATVFLADASLSSPSTRPATLSALCDPPPL